MIMQKRILDKVQIILFSCFLFLWYISANEKILRIISICIFGMFSIIEIIKILYDKKIAFNSSLLSYLFLVLFGFISMLWAVDDDAVVSKSTELLMGFIFLTLSYNYFIKLDQPTELIIKVIKIVGIVFSVYVVLYYGVTNYFNMLLSGRRIGTEIINVNFIGIITSINFILLLYDLILENKGNNVVTIVLATISLIVALGTGSKKAIIVILLGITVILFKKFKQKFTIKNVITTFIFVIAIILVASFFYNGGYLDTIFNRFEAMLNTLSNDDISTGSTYIRKMFIKSGLEEFFKSPLVGIGLNNSKIITYELFREETYLHCNYIELLACTGIIGFCLFYYIYYYVLYNCIKNITLKNADIVILIFIINLFLDIGNVSYYEIKTFLYLLLGIVFVGNIKREIKKDEFKEKNKKSN